jgi:hypothetical protein
VTPAKKRYVAYLRSAAWQTRRMLAFAVYGRHCARCPTTTNLHVHHKTYARFGAEPVEDLLVLCESCHAAEHRSPKKKKRAPRPEKPKRNPKRYRKQKPQKARKPKAKRQGLIDANEDLHARQLAARQRREARK